MIKSEAFEELKILHEAGRKGREWIINLEAEEREKTKIPSLKVGYNKVFRLLYRSYKNAFE